MMKNKEKFEAIRLRCLGFSIKEIESSINASKSSISVWVSDIKLTDDQKIRLNKLGNGNGYYCKEAKLEYERNPNKCMFCNKTLSYVHRHNRFCNSKCANVRCKAETKKCLLCGKETKNLNFCSLKCNTDYKWNKKIAICEKTGMAPPHQATAKRLIKKIKSEKCEMCGSTEWMGEPIPLVLDHIDGNSDNWKLKNLRLVCGNCNMKLSTFTSKNKNSGRLKKDKRNKYRRKYYGDVR